MIFKKIVKTLEEIMRDEGGRASPISSHALRKNILLGTVPSFHNERGQKMKFDEIDQDFISSTLRLRNIDLPVEDIKKLHNFIWRNLYKDRLRIYDKDLISELKNKMKSNIEFKNELNQIQKICEEINTRVGIWEETLVELKKRHKDLNDLMKELIKISEKK